MPTLSIRSLSNDSSDQPRMLERGKACYHCRYRKMRCDGVQPICGQCERANRPDDCEYTNGQRRARAEVLQENIARVQDRIKELENPRQKTPELRLYQPYQATSVPTITSKPPSPKAPITISRTTEVKPDEFPMEVVTILINSFLPYSSQIGFFLNPTRFRESALIPQPLDQHSHPTSALLATVYLWGLRLSKIPQMQIHEPEFLSRALTLTNCGLSDPHPQKVLHTLQAHILLANYFLADGRFLEGKYHTSAVISILLSASLTTIRSDRFEPSRMIPPPRDVIEEGERIQGCWMGLILDKTWAVALCEGRHLDRQSQKTIIDTPWPLDIHDYEKARGQDYDSRHRDTIRNFISRTPTCDRGTSSIALQAKAVILWQRADVVVREWTRCMPREHIPTFTSNFRSFGDLIDDFIESLRPLDKVASPNPSIARNYVVAYSIAYASSMQLNIISFDPDASWMKRVAAAEAIFKIITDAAPLHDFALLNPIMGQVWVSACQVLVEEIRRLRTGFHTVEAARHATLLKRGIIAISNFSGMCALLDHQISWMQEAIAEIQRR